MGKVKKVTAQESKFWTTHWIEDQKKDIHLNLNDNAGLVTVLNLKPFLVVNEMCGNFLILRMKSK